MSYSDPNFQTTDDLEAVGAPSPQDDPGVPYDDGGPAPDDHTPGFQTTDELAALPDPGGGASDPGVPYDDGSSNKHTSPDFQTTDDIAFANDPGVTLDTSTPPPPAQEDPGEPLPVEAAQATPPTQDPGVPVDHGGFLDRVKDFGKNALDELGKVAALPERAIFKSITDDNNNPFTDPGSFIKDTYGNAAGGVASLASDFSDVGKRAEANTALSIADFAHDPSIKGAIDIATPQKNIFNDVTGDANPWDSPNTASARQVLEQNPLSAVLPGTAGGGDAGIYDVPVVGGLARAGTSLVGGALQGDYNPSIDTGKVRQELSQGQSVAQVQKENPGNPGYGVLGDLANPTNFVEIPGVAEAIHEIMTPATQKAVGEVTDKLAAHGDWAPEATPELKAAVSDSGGFDMSKPNAARAATDVQVAYTPGASDIAQAPQALATLYDGAALMAKGEDATGYANAIAETYGGTVAGNLDHMRTLVEGKAPDAKPLRDLIGGTVDTGEAVSKELAKTGEALRTGNIPTRDFAQAAEKRGVDLSNPQAINPQDLAAVRAQAARDIYTSDIREAWYARAGAKLPEDASALSKGMQGVANTVRGLLLAASAPPLALQKFTDEYFRAITQGTVGIRLADTNIGQAVSRFGESRNIFGNGDGFRAFGEKGTVRNLASQGRLAPDALLNSAKSDTTIGSLFSGKDRYGNKIGIGKQLAQTYEAPGRALSKWNDSLISAPTQHVVKNAAYQDIRKIAEMRADLASRVQYDVFVRTQDHVAAQEAGDIIRSANNRADILAAANRIDATAGRAAIGAPEPGGIDPHLMDAIGRTGGRDLGLVADSQSTGRGAVTRDVFGTDRGAGSGNNEFVKEILDSHVPKTMDDVAAHMASTRPAANGAADQAAVKDAALARQNGNGKTAESYNTGGARKPDAMGESKSYPTGMSRDEIRKQYGPDVGKYFRGEATADDIVARALQSEDPLTELARYRAASYNFGTTVTAEAKNALEKRLNNAVVEFRKGNGAVPNADPGVPMGDTKLVGDVPTVPQGFLDTGENLLHGTSRTFDRFGGDGAVNRYGEPVRGGEKYYFTDQPSVANNFRDGGAYRHLDPEQTYQAYQDGELDDIRAGLDKRIAGGGVVQHLDDGGNWVNVRSAADISDANLVDGNVRTLRSGRDPRTIETQVYGKTLDMTDPAAIPPDLSARLRREGVYDPEVGYDFAHEKSRELVNYMRENGYSKANVKDAVESGGRSTLALPDAIGYGRTPEDVYRTLVDDPAKRYAAEQMDRVFGGASTPLREPGVPLDEKPPVAAPPVVDPGVPAPQAHAPVDAVAPTSNVPTDLLRKAAAEYEQIARGQVQKGLERGYRIVGNNGDQTALGATLKNGLGGVTPPVLPFAPFHVHSTQFWASYFASHPAMAVSMAQVLGNLDDYGTLHLPGGATVNGLVKTTTGLHLEDWIKKAYGYDQAVAQQGNNNPFQRVLKDVGYNVFGNNAFVRPFDYISGPLTSLTQDFTHPLMSGKKDFNTGKPLVDSRDQMSEYGAMAGTTGVGETLNDLTGGHGNRGLIQDLTNPGQWLGNQFQKVTDNIPGLNIDRTPYTPEKAEAHTLGLVADQRGLSKYDAEKAYYNPQTPQEIALGKELHDAVHLSMDTTAIGKLAPVQTAPAQTPDQAKGIFQPNKASSYELDKPIAAGFTVRDFLSQPGNLFDLDAQLREAQANGDQQKMKDIERAIAGVKASDGLTHPEVKGYLDASKAQATATYGDTSFRGGLKPNEQQALDAFNDLRSKSDYQRHSELGKEASAVAGGKDAPKGSAEHNAYADFWAKNSAEYGRLTDILAGAEQSIVDRYGVNPKELANRQSAASGKAAAFPDTSIKGNPPAPTSAPARTSSGGSTYTAPRTAQNRSGTTFSTNRGNQSNGTASATTAALSAKSDFYAQYNAIKAESTKTAAAVRQDAAIQNVLTGKHTAEEWQAATAKAQAIADKAKGGTQSGVQTRTQTGVQTGSQSAPVTYSGPGFGPTDIARLMSTGYLYDPGKPAPGYATGGSNAAAPSKATTNKSTYTAPTTDTKGAPIRNPAAYAAVVERNKKKAA